MNLLHRTLFCGLAHCPCIYFHTIETRGALTSSYIFRECIASYIFNEFECVCVCVWCRVVMGMFMLLFSWTVLWQWRRGLSFFQMTILPCLSNVKTSVNSRLCFTAPTVWEWSWRHVGVQLVWIKAGVPVEPMVRIGTRYCFCGASAASVHKMQVHVKVLLLYIHCNTLSQTLSEYNEHYLRIAIC